MLTRALALSTAALLFTGVAFAGAPEDKSKKSASKPIPLHFCPETDEAVQGEPAGSQIVGKYKVFFCCGGCKTSFNKLSREDKEKKVAELAKKHGEKKKG